MLSEEKISVTVIRTLISNPNEVDLDTAKKSGSNGTITKRKSDLFQDLITLPVPESEWQTPEEVSKQGGIKEKEPHVRDFRVFKWEYFPKNKKARVYVYNDPNYE